MGMVIRTLYNNSGWSEACIEPYEDSYCMECIHERERLNQGLQPKRQIQPPLLDDKQCSGECWERSICTKYRWGCTPKGRRFRYAFKGDKVYLAFILPKGLYRIWGVTKVKSIDFEPMSISNGWGTQQYVFVHFEPFSSLPQEKWGPPLEATQLVGTEWRTGGFRYISVEQESYLDSLLEGKQPDIQPPIDEVSVTIKVKAHIYSKLDSIASDQGRSIEDLIRQAIAEFIGGGKA